METRRGTVSEVIDSRRISDLPLNVAGVGRRGGVKAITAMAAKLARLVYRMLEYGH